MKQWALNIDMYEDADSVAVTGVLSEYGWTYNSTLGLYVLQESSSRPYPVVTTYQTMEALAKIEKNRIYNFQFFQIDSVNDASQLLKQMTLKIALQKGLDSGIAPPGTFERLRAKYSRAPLTEEDKKND